MAGLQDRDDAYTKPGVPDELKWQPVMRGFPEDVEVLTEYGWVLFSVLYRAGVYGVQGDPSPLFDGEVDWSQEHKPLREKWFENKTKHQLGYDFAHHNEVDFTKWRVGSRFPRVATLTADHVVKNRAQHGSIVFERPVFATRFSYQNLQLVHFKRRGLDLAVPRFTDVLVRNYMQSSWVFSVADDFCVARKTPNVYKMMVNRYAPSGVLYGDVDVSRLLSEAGALGLKALMTNKHPVKVMLDGKQVSRKRIWDVYPFPEVRDPVSGRYVRNPKKRTSVECFNLVLPVGSSHTLIVRRAGKVVAGEQPHTEWVGFPVVVGDGYDKNLIHVDRVKGAYSG